MLPRIVPIIAAGLVLAACNADITVTPVPDTPVPRPVPPPPAITTGAFELTSAEGQSLPAYIAHRLVNGTLEQVYVDSAHLAVLDGGRFEQRIWTRILRGGALSHRETWVDAGTWQRDGATYTFASAGGSRALTVRTAASPTLTVIERMVAWPNAGLVVGVYAPRPASPVPPAQPPVQETRYRATDVSGQPLSAIVVTERDVPHDGAETFSQLDSAWVALRTDGTYERRAFYSTHMSPNYRLSLGYSRVARFQDYDAGQFTRGADGMLTFVSSYWQNRTAQGTLSGDRLRLMQDMTAGDAVRPNVGYSRREAQ